MVSRHTEDKYLEYKISQEHLLHSHIDVLVQERRQSIANALELRLSRTNPSI